MAMNLSWLEVSHGWRCLVVAVTIVYGWGDTKTNIIRIYTIYKTMRINIDDLHWLCDSKWKGACDYENGMIWISQDLVFRRCYSNFWKDVDFDYGFNEWIKRKAFG